MNVQSSMVISLVAMSDPSLLGRRSSVDDGESCRCGGAGDAARVLDGREARLLHLREARSRNANLPDITYHLALALHALGRDGEARDELTTLMRSKKEFPDRAAAEQLLQQLSR